MLYAEEYRIINFLAKWCSNLISDETNFSPGCLNLEPFHHSLVVVDFPPVSQTIVGGSILIGGTLVLHKTPAIQSRELHTAYRIRFSKC